MQSSGP